MVLNMELQDLILLIMHPNYLVVQTNFQSLIEGLVTFLKA